MSGHPLKLIVGLGNPGPQHDSNRHNAGVIFLHHLCKAYAGSLRGESKFFGEFATIAIAGHDVKLLFPTTFMNHSGKSVAAVCRFFKKDGGHGGHNGLRDIINALGGSKEFYRLRIGVGHPGHKSMVSNYVLGDPSRSEADVIMSNIEDAIRVLPKAVNGEWEDAMHLLHTD
jgi:PTH1 family peptidyl-tRNA hydrolase